MKKTRKITKLILSAFAVLCLLSNSVLAENMYQNSDFIEKEQPEISEETKQLISLYQKSPTEENYLNLRDEVIKNYNAVLERKEQKLADLKTETSGKPGGDAIVAEMEDIVQDMYKTYWNRINSSMLRFTDTRLLKWRIADAPRYDYIPVMGAGKSIYVKRTQVTNAEYAEFLKDTGKNAPSNWENGEFTKGEEDYPVNFVSVDDAKAYCEWLTEKDGRTSVYEYAEVTRGAHGAIDFWGNVWERTSTARDENGESYGVKGGSWKSDRTDCRTEYREEARNGAQGYEDVGFRVIKVLDGAEPEQTVQLATLSNPTVYAASSSNDSINLSWTAVDGANEYQIFEYFKDTGLVKMLDRTKDTGITISGLENGSTHSYIVQPISYVEIADNVFAENSVSATCGQNEDDIKIFVNGTQIDFSKYDNVMPVIENGRTLVPVRAVSETLLCEVLWHDDTQEIDITKGDIFVKLTIGNTTAYVNGKQIQLDTAPDIRSGRTLVPLRFIAESLKLNVEWNGDSRTITIKPFNSSQFIITA